MDDRIEVLADQGPYAFKDLPEAAQAMVRAAVDRALAHPLHTVALLGDGNPEHSIVCALADDGTFVPIGALDTFTLEWGRVCRATFTFVDGRVHVTDNVKVVSHPKTFDEFVNTPLDNPLA